MMELDTSAWRPIGETSNTKYFEVEPEVILAVPHAGAIDTFASAKENTEFQNGHWRRAGHGGVVVVLFDRMTAQEKDARKVYQSDPDPAVMRATALVGGSLLGRAIASFFFGFTKPRIPIKLFGTIDEALVWARDINQGARA